MQAVYRPSANPPETAWARHLDQVMRDRKWSRVRLFEEVGAELGYSDKSRSAFLKLLEDRDPTETQARVLRQHFGDPPATASEPATATESADPLVVALNRQSEAIERLVALLEGDLPERVAALEPVVRRLAELDLEGWPTRRVPDGSAG